MYKLQFSPLNEVNHYEICTQALFLTNKVPAIEEFDTIVSLVKKLKSIGKIAQIQNGAQLYDLAADGEITITVAEYALLQRYIMHPMWRPAALEAVLATRDWLTALKAVAKSTPHG